MDSEYFIVKNQLSELGYTDPFPREAFLLVRNLFSDLLDSQHHVQELEDHNSQTIRDLDMWKKNLDQLVNENRKLISENKQLKKDTLREAAHLQALSRELDQVRGQAPQRKSTLDASDISFLGNASDTSFVMELQKKAEQHITQLEQENYHIVAANRDLESQVEKLEQLLETKETEISLLGQSLDQLNQQLQKNNRHVVDTKSSLKMSDVLPVDSSKYLEELQQTNDALHNELLQVSKDSLSLSEKLQNAMKEKDELESQLISLKRHSSQKEFELKMSTDDALRLKNMDFESLKQQLELMSLERDRSDQHRQRLEQTLRQLDQSHLMPEDYDNVVRSLLHEKDVLVAELSKLREDSENWKQRCKALTESELKLNDDLQNSEREKQENVEKSEKLSRELGGLHHTLFALKEEKEKLLDEVTSIKTSLEQAEVEKHRIHLSSKRAATELDALKAELLAKNDRIDHFQPQLESLEEEKNALSSKVAEQQLSLNQLEALLASKESDIASLTSRIDLAAHDLAVAHTQAEEKDRILNDVNEERKKLKNEAEMVFSQLEQLELKKEKLRKKAEMLSHDKKHLEATLGHVEQERDIFFDEIQKLNRLLETMDANEQQEIKQNGTKMNSVEHNEENKKENVKDQLRQMLDEIRQFKMELQRSVLDHSIDLKPISPFRQRSFV